MKNLPLLLNIQLCSQAASLKKNEIKEPIEIIKVCRLKGKKACW